MKRWLAAAIAFALLGEAHSVDPTRLPDPTLQARYEALTHELRCVKCQNQSIADSPAGLAADLRIEVRDLLLAGKSDGAVRDHMVARYGEFILFRPRFSLRNAWLWLAPLVLMLIGAIAAVRILRQRGALLAEDTDPVDEEASR